MKSIRSIYKIGLGPSSSHTMGPAFAADRFLKIYDDADYIKVILLGSLAKTGKGHGTDRAISEILSSVKHDIVFDCESKTPVHPNTLEFIAYKDDVVLGNKIFYSIGGGEILAENEEKTCEKQVYTEKSFTEIASLCKSKNIRLSDYVFEHEDADFKHYLLSVWKTMLNAIN